MEEEGIIEVEEVTVVEVDILVEVELVGTYTWAHTALSSGESFLQRIRNASGKVVRNPLSNAVLLTKCSSLLQVTVMHH